MNFKITPEQRGIIYDALDQYYEALKDVEAPRSEKRKVMRLINAVDILGRVPTKTPIRMAKLRQVTQEF